ncbi:MAG: gliding motility-associated C-terminal domain-containing protein [Bacteroidota bacterium]
MKKNYLLVVILLSFFPFYSSAITNSLKANPKAVPLSSIIDNSSLIFLAPTSTPTVSLTSLCEDESLTLFANLSEALVAPYTLEWTGPNGFTSTTENPIISNITTAASGSYTLTIYDSSNGNAIVDVQSTVAVTVNAKIDPTFDATLPAICRNAPAPILSTTSTNGITGTWNPATVSNTTTGNYLFTPNTGQCAKTYLFTVFIVNNVTPVFTIPSTICQGDAPPVLPTTSNNGIQGTWSPSTISNTTSGSYTFTPNAGQCTNPIPPISVTVRPYATPTFTIASSVCENATAPILPGTSNNGITGTWNPATVTTTPPGDYIYTFTPTPGQCTNPPASITIRVNPYVTPTFTPIAPICENATAPILPTTSNEGITGTWSPATVSNTTSGNYTFTANLGQCVTTPTANMSIVVIPITAIFTQVQPICEGDALAPLPTTSNNGITGTWAPAMNNTQTTTYTFTPDTPQCATATVSMTIVVNPLIAVFTQVPPICGGDPLTPLPTTSNNGITGTWAPALDNTTTTTYTFTPTAGQCATATVTMTIVVNPLIAVFTQIPPICEGDALVPLPTTSNNAITGTWAPALNNTQTTTYTFTPDTAQCATATVTMTIVVNPLIAVFTQAPPICEGDALAPLPTTSNNGITGTWAPALNNTQTTTYTFTPNAPQCATATVTMTIVVNPLIAVFTQIPPICEGDALAPLPTTSNNGITGTWTPALNNTQTTTYTFTPDTAQCATATVTMTIVVNPLIAVFTQVPPICEGDALAPLPTTSNNAITGTWAPALNNTQTTTYTFTPDVAQCASATVNMTIVVNPITAIFTQVPPICSGDALANLPTTSNNGVTGTWAPAIDNTTTTTYTFTPTAGQCTTNPTTMTIVVNPIAAIFTQVPPICEGGALANLPTTSNNGVTGIWTPAIDNTTTTTYTFTPDAAQCTINPTTMTIVVNPIAAIFTQVPPICSGDALANLPTTSNNGVIGIWAPAIDNTTTTTYTFTPTAGQCTTNPATMTIVVNPIAAIFTQVPPICSGDALANLPTTSNNGVTGTWAPAIDNTTTTTYTFTPDAAQCTTNPTTMTIVVNPIAAIFTQVPPICSGDALANLPTTSNNGVIGIWAPAIDNTTTTTYTFTPTAGQCTTNPATMTIVVNPIAAIFTQVPPICSGDALANLPTTSNNGVTGTWAPAIDNTTTTLYTFTPTAGQCATATVNMTIVVNPTTAIFTQVPPICEGNALANLPTTSNNGVTGTWAPAMNNITTTLYTFTPTAGQCTINPTTMTIVVNPTTAIFTQMPPICSGDALANLPTTSNNGVTGTWAPAMNNTTTTLYTFTPTAGQCATATANMTISVNQKITPTFNPIADVCYSSATIPTLPATSINGITGTWNPATVSNTTSGTYTFTPNNGFCANQTTLAINVNIITPVFNPITPICQGAPAPTLPLTSTNGITGNWNATINTSIPGTVTYTFTPNVEQCAISASLPITINPTAATFNPIGPICNGDILVLPTVSNNNVNGSWSPTFDNTQTQTYTFTPTAGQCATGTVTMQIVVNQKTTPTFTAIAPICSGETSPILSLTSNNGITGTWNPATVSNTASNIYTFTPTSGLCASTTTLSVMVYQSPTDIAFTSTDVVNDKAEGTITISGVTSGLAPFEYSINNSSFTTNTSYSNLAPGDYTITVKDSNGCEFSNVASVNSLCVFPNAISPNDDGFNDTLNLNGCNVGKLILYNRYGREINKIDNYTNQWAGTNEKGEHIPDGTYFYVAEIKDGTSKSGWIYVAR